MIDRRNAWVLGIVTALFTCAGCSAGPLRSDSPAAPPALAQPGTSGGPYLYVGGLKISQYALGSTKPLRTIDLQGPYEVIALATDSSGHLFAEYGNPTSGGVIVVYDALTLAQDYVIPNTAGWGSIALDSKGSLYYCFGDPVLVYPPGHTKQLYEIRSHAHDAHGLAFDPSGDLYTDGGRVVSAFAPDGPNGRMKWMRSFSDGVEDSDKLAFAPNGDLYVADFPDCNPPCGKPSVNVYPPGASKPSLTIKSGIEAPAALAIDSKERLYVADEPLSNRGKVVVYDPGGVRPIRTIKDGVNRPVALDFDPSGNLYVANEDGNSVSVYSPGGAKLLRTITKGIRIAASMTIGSP